MKPPLANSAACQAEAPRTVERLLVRGSAAEFLHGTWRRMMGTDGQTYRSYSHESVMKQTMETNHHSSSFFIIDPNLGRNSAAHFPLECRTNAEMTILGHPPMFGQAKRGVKRIHPRWSIDGVDSSYFTRVLEGVDDIFKLCGVGRVFLHPSFIFIIHHIQRY